MPDRKEEGMACQFCGRAVSVSYVADPYELEMRGVENMVYICDQCYENRLDDLEEEGEYD